jgi:hypothetical protein
MRGDSLAVADRDEPEERAQQGRKKKGKHMKSRSMIVGGAMALLMSVGHADAGVIYSQDFSSGGNTDFSYYNAATDGGVSGGMLTWSLNGSYGNIGRDIGAGNLWTWSTSNPIELAATIQRDGTATAQAYGLYLAAGTKGSVTGSGIAFQVFWNDSTNEGFIAKPDGNNRVNQTVDLNPLPKSVAAGGNAFYSIGLSIRENASVSGDFDVLVTIDGNEQYGGWVTLSKSTYNITAAQPFQSFGLVGDGNGRNNYVDSVSLSVIPEPGSGLMLMGALAGIGLLRKKLHGRA